MNREKMESKGIESVASRVANIRELPGYSGPDTVEAFLQNLVDGAAADYGTARAYTSEESVAIRQLAEKKYSTWDWIFGQSGEYRVGREKRFDFGSVSVSLDACRGVIRRIAFSGDYFGAEDPAQLAARLVGCRLEMEALTAALADCGKYIYKSTSEQLAALILGQ